MKPLLFFFCCCIFISCGESNEKVAETKNDSSTAPVPADSSRPKEEAKPSYSFAIPQGWTTEHIPFPIDFAPGIPFKGFEDLRFPAGWGDTASDEHWSYMFLWWLEGQQSFDNTTLEKYYTEYYSGLVGRNIEQRKIPKDRIVPTKVQITKLAAATGDRETYSGKINMLNYMTQKPIVLNIKVHVKDCKEAGRTAVFNEISPQPDTHRIWKEFEGLTTKFSCSSN